MNNMNKEIAYVLTGEFSNGIWFTKMRWRRKGSESSVLFDGAKVLRQEELAGDVVGFYHTHPCGLAQPSARDDATMMSWSFCFGKPLICAIETDEELKAWVYDAGNVTCLALVAARFKPGWLVASESKAIERILEKMKLAPWYGSE